MIDRPNTGSLDKELATILILSFLIFSFLIFSQPGEAAGETSSPADLFEGDRAWQVDSVLALPMFDGRRAGSAGGRAAEEWIASRFGEAGLEPGSKEGGYFQEFPVIGYREKATSLELLDGPFGKIQLVHGDDYTLLLTPGSGSVTAEAVLIGYGIDAPEKGRDDYEGCDLTGKVAVILRGRPGDGQDWDEEYSRNHTFPAAVAHGAVAVLYFQDDRPVAGAALARHAYRPDIPAGYVSERTIHLLLRETGWTLEEVQEKLKEGPFPLPTGKRIRFKAKSSGQAEGRARNVLGRIRGTDPILGTEIVIIGAHHDHIGFDAAGRLYAGANDNASGTSVVVELARALQSSGWHPRRTVLFVTFAGEEMGLLGSKHLASNLPVDSSRVVAMLNLDMVGQGDGGFGIAGGARLGRPYLTWRAALDSARAAVLEEYRVQEGNSDHAPFADHGIPAATTWSRGEHRRYHDFEDRSRYVRPGILEVVGRGIGSLLVTLADHPEPLADGFGRERILRARAIQVGFTPLGRKDLADPDLDHLGGEGRISGRLIALDQGNGETHEVLQGLGRLVDTCADRPWLDLAEEIHGVEKAWEKLRIALMPVISTVTLDRLGWEVTEGLCAAGLAGAYWPPDAPVPSVEVCERLARSGRFLIATTTSDWRAVSSRGEDLRVMLRADPLTPVPAPPDSSYRDRTILILRIEGLADSTRIRETLTLWSEAHFHLDIAAGLEQGVRDEESLRFIAWLRREGWEEARIQAALGENLRSF